MTGVVAVVGTQLFLRVLKLEVLTVGTGGVNAGAITCQAVGGGQAWDRIIAGEGINQNSLITVPANKNFHVEEWAVSSSALVALTARIMIRTYTDGAWNSWIVEGKKYTYFGGEVGDQHPVNVMGIAIPEKSDIKMNVTVGGAASVSSHMRGILLDN